MKLETKQLKDSLRRHVLAKRKSYSTKDIETLSQVYSERLMQMSIAQSAHFVLAYFATSQELDLRLFYDWCLKEGKTLCFPRSEEGEFYHFAEVSDLKASFQKAAYGIYEPKENCERFCEDDSHATHTLIMVPGLAFNDRGYRLGYGKGIYDQLLQDYSGYRIGVTQPEFTEMSFPQDPWDKPVEFVLSSF
tara:strand:- start:143 stop:715 length:573 start_codon:yes stop_codon:yes gene_type:complete